MLSDWERRSSGSRKPGRQGRHARAGSGGRRKSRGSNGGAGSGQRLLALAAKWAAKWVLVVGIWMIVLVGSVVAWYGSDLPDVDEAIAATRQPAVTVLAANGSELATSGDLFGLAVEVGELPPALPLAVMATEDRRFYDHLGIDPVGLARAAVANIRAGGIVQGGSTITQQVAKNLFLTHERTIERKVQELLLALWLERKFTKDQIFSLYLNRAYFGAGTYGVDAAARKYFGVPAARVSTYQAAMLAGLLRAPSRYNPLASAKLADGRARQVLASMIDAAFITEKEAAAAIEHPGRLIALAGSRTGSRYFVDWVLEQVPAFVAADDKDLVVTTTLDPELQKLAELRVNALLEGPAVVVDASQAALVAMAPDGAVRAMVGGRDYRTSQFNRAVQARRQPGSAFKPFVYLAGLEAGLSPWTRLVDGPVAVGDWRPTNFSEGFRGEISMQEALALSINTVAVQVSEHAGRDQVIDAARRLGLSTAMEPTPSLALGVDEVSLTELTAAYAPFANGGIGVWPHGIEAIHDRSGRLLYMRGGDGPGRVISERNAAQITQMLVAAIDTGTGRAADLSRPAAGKTGTSQRFRDAWFIGFTADLIAGVWVGNDDDAPMRRVTGGGLPARLWHDFMVDAHRELPVRPLPSLAPIHPAAPPEPRIASPAPSAEPARGARQDEDGRGFLERLIERIAGG